MSLSSPFRVLKTARARRVLLLALVALAAWPLVARVAARALIVSAEPRSADAVVVLAGSSAYEERARRAAEIFREGRATKVLLTDDGEAGGWSQELERNPRFVERAAKELARAGVPRESVETLPQIVSSTHDEALLVREYARARGLRSILIVTSAYHSRRALWTFRRVLEGSGVAVGLEPVAPGEQMPTIGTWWLTLRGWRVVAGEHLKMVYYRMRY
ncbi:MAG TPA: YdcF family protein [Pyrinomonadaceae bacterium]|nr:YdcF family protein [Pyrinomonadaceae bacterium]